MVLQITIKVNSMNFDKFNLIYDSDALMNSSRDVILVTILESNLTNLKIY